MSGEESKPRPKEELLATLAWGLRLFMRMSPEDQRLVDAERFVPTLEMHEILHHYLAHGRFHDDTPCRRCA